MTALPKFFIAEIINCRNPKTGKLSKTALDTVKMFLGMFKVGDDDYEYEISGDGKSVRYIFPNIMGVPEMDDHFKKGNTYARLYSSNDMRGEVGIQ